MNTTAFIFMSYATYHIGSLKKPFKKKILLLSMTSVAVYILERVFGETPDPILLVIDIVSAFLMGGLSHIIHFHHDKKIHLPFRKKKKPDEAQDK